MKTFKYSFPIGIAFYTLIRCSERTTQPESNFFCLDFPCYFDILILIVCLYAKKISYLAFTCVNPLLFSLPFIIFVLTPFSMSFKFNFDFSVNTISLNLQKLQNFTWFSSYQETHYASENWYLKYKKNDRVLGHGRRGCHNFAILDGRKNFISKETTLARWRGGFFEKLMKSKKSNLKTQLQTQNLS